MTAYLSSLAFITASTVAARKITLIDETSSWGIETSSAIWADDHSTIQFSYFWDSVSASVDKNEALVDGMRFLNF